MAWDGWGSLMIGGFLAGTGPTILIGQTYRSRLFALIPAYPRLDRALTILGSLSLVILVVALKTTGGGYDGIWLAVVVIVYLTAGNALALLLYLFTHRSPPVLLLPDLAIWLICGLVAVHVLPQIKG
ncbi:hypothetical protein VK792_07195 [Mesobacterium sp. TK19101]|uniref:Uncharacterized protein n=1 Tax=Mesobacterium hydrothermale TaxID=3111907 RepID=A0ABU6HF53_9RHOB|nr:hypothetical protein [Mesobacterium sp. TK19101]MEC3861067.1 hypothetical protein [Mesobacterium sp. TK19101]